MNSGGQGALNAGEQVIIISEKIKAPIIKALLGKAAVPDYHPNSLGWNWYARYLSKCRGNESKQIHY